MSGILAQFERLIAAGELTEDADQRHAATRLNGLQKELEAERPGGLLGQFFGTKRAQPQGIYMWGGVGRGKSMLMDLFVETLAIKQKRRVHFHEFMLEVDARMKLRRESDPGDPVGKTAADLAENIRCLAFDEMVVTNTADAAIMSRLFTALIRDQGVTIVTTSNRPPKDLYKDGLNRSLFLPFIDLVEDELETISLNGPVDYRLNRIGNIETWHSPLGDSATEAMREAFFRLTDYNPEDAQNVPSAELALSGSRTLHVPKSLKGVGVFSFKRLCGENRGAADYLALARAYHTVIVVGIPVMGPDLRNEAIRFTKLIDALYELRVKLFAAADAAPDALYTKGDGSFEFDRTVSRLIEMQSEEYMALGHGPEG
jgi:cell division protein ZapE